MKRKFYFRNRFPVFGAILVEGEDIDSVEIYDESSSVSDIMQNLREWNPVNLEKYYISPGIIDLDVDLPDSPTRIEETTKAAVSGGVTLACHQ